MHDSEGAGTQQCVPATRLMLGSNCRSAIATLVERQSRYTMLVHLPDNHGAITVRDGLPSLLKECWEEGVVLAGVSAGSLCWHTGGPTDSFGDSLRPFTNGLGFLPFSNGVHDDFTDQPRRRTYRQLVATGEIDAGYATEDGVGLHYRGTSLSEVVTVRPGSCAWRVDPDAAGGYTEEPVKARPL